MRRSRTADLGHGTNLLLLYRESLHWIKHSEEGRRFEASKVADVRSRAPDTHFRKMQF
jgi:hypothetical protein